VGAGRDTRNQHSHRSACQYGGQNAHLHRSPPWGLTRRSREGAQDTQQAQSTAKHPRMSKPTGYADPSPAVQHAKDLGTCPLPPGEGPEARPDYFRGNVGAGEEGSTGV
jgi:hypothetical protein